MSRLYKKIINIFIDKDNLIMDKYARTFHLPWSKGATNDDKISKDINRLLNVPIIISEKIDGGNSSLELGGVYARTHAAIPTHESFDWLKAFHSQIKYKIPEGIQLFGENVWALHSIFYSELPGYFLLFNVRDINKAEWTSWEEVEMWAEEIGVPTVPVLFKGIVSSEEELKELTDSLMKENSKCGGEREGVVVRIQSSFLDSEFSSCVMKQVRERHVKTNIHWKDQKIIKNGLKLK